MGRTEDRKTQVRAAFHRVELLAGAQGMERLREARVILFGLGGVGSWSAEALVRSGIEHLTMVDADVVCATNINRQVQASWDTVGTSKADALRGRLLSINPDAGIAVRKEVYDRTTSGAFDLQSFDYIVDAIDSLSPKLELIVRAGESGKPFFSALGASCKLDPTRIRIGSIWESQGCRLGRFVRKKLRNRGFAGDFVCVYSDELVENHDAESGSGAGEWRDSTKQINGSAVHITGMFGFMLAGLVIQDILGRTKVISPKFNEIRTSRPLI